MYASPNLPTHSLSETCVHSTSFVLCRIWQVKPVGLCFSFYWVLDQFWNVPLASLFWMGTRLWNVRPHQHCPFQKKVLTGCAVPVCSVTEKCWPDLEINREGINLTHRFSLAWLLAALALGEGTHERQCFQILCPWWDSNPAWLSYNIIKNTQNTVKYTPNTKVSWKRDLPRHSIFYFSVWVIKRCWF